MLKNFVNKKTAVQIVYKNAQFCSAAQNSNMLNSLYNIQALLKNMQKNFFCWQTMDDQNSFSSLSKLSFLLKESIKGFSSESLPVHLCNTVQFSLCS